MERIERIVADIQAYAMSMRMVPAMTVFQRFPRMVRDIAKSHGKQIEVQIFGEDTELDKQVAEKLGTAIGKKLKIVDVPQTGWLDAMMKGGMPKPFAESYVEMYTAFGSGKVRPNGDRLVQGKTTLDEVVRTLV